ncbi:MAG: hypothetical protein II180_03370 [Proteobacteria bacterium]|nr:hypothetical protein [Pseudomonadota bacterium]
MRRQLSKSDLSQNCVNICGPGFHYDRPGGKLGGREQVCTRYPYDCGYACTTGWDFEYLKGGTEYTCQTAIQNPPQVVAPVQQMSEKEVRDQDCVNICGPGFHYDRPGDQLDGREQVCTRYPYDCGYACTTGWDFEYLKDGTEYTCQTAIQNPPQVVAPARQMNEKEARDQDCVSICGPGFHYDRPGGKLGGREQVCTRYPYDCGYACTTGWDFEYLKDGTEYTCQTAIQQP